MRTLESSYVVYFKSLGRKLSVSQHTSSHVHHKTHTELKRRTDNQTIQTHVSMQLFIKLPNNRISCQTRVSGTAVLTRYIQITQIAFEVKIKHYLPSTFQIPKS
jgi:hypothetical protein